MGRPLAILIAAGWLASACNLVLGIDTDFAAPNIITCGCVALTEQGAAFEQGCVEELEQIDDRTGLAEQGCNDCGAAVECYAAITSASEMGDACSASEDCASWACCQGLSVVITLAPSAVAVVPTSSACCCACGDCQAALESLLEGAEAVACPEVLPLIEQLAQCAKDVPIGAMCANECSGSEEDGACASCRIGAALASPDSPCAEELAACEADLPRPRGVQVGEGCEP